MRYSFNSVDDKTGGTDDAGDRDGSVKQDGLSGNDNVSLFGLKGSVGDDGLKAFYHLQTGAPTDKNTKDSSAFNQRFYFAGLEGGFGKAAYGRMTNAYKFDGFKLDPFYNLSHIGADGTFSSGLASYGLSPATNGFTDNALQYTSPAFAGVKINAGVYIDDGDEDNHSTIVGASWKGKGFNAGLQFASNNNDGKVNGVVDPAADTQVLPGIYQDGDALRLHGGFKAKNWSAGISYEMVDDTKENEAKYMYLVGRFNVTPNTELVATVGTVDPGDKDKASDASLLAEGTGFQLAVFQTVVPKTQMYLSYGTASLDYKDVDGTGLEDPSVISIGAIHKFGFGG